MGAGDDLDAILLIQEVHTPVVGFCLSADNYISMWKITEKYISCCIVVVSKIETANIVGGE